MSLAVKGERAALTSGQRRTGLTPARLGLYGFVVLFLLWTLVPIIWMVLSSFRTQASMLATSQRS